MSQRPAARQAASSLSPSAESKPTPIHAALSRQIGARRLVPSRLSDLGPSNAEAEFMQAMQDYKQSSGRMFPTWSEVLEVLKTLGSTKIS